MKLPDLGLGLTAKGGRKREFLEQMRQDDARSELAALIDSRCTCTSSVGSPRFALVSIPRILFQQVVCAERLGQAREVGRLPTVRSIEKA